mgnify:FL=1
MKRLIQLSLFFLLFFIAIIFYKSYFTNQTPKKIINQKVNDDTNLTEMNKNNLIKNLKYDVRLNDDSQYTITSDLSEILYEGNVESVSMNIVIAKFIGSDGTVLTITSDKAIFNNNIYDTKFYDNVNILYLDHVIFSDKLDLNFTKNNVVIYDNVVYQGSQGDIITDNILINLITKNVEIFMNNPKNNVTVSTN